MSGKQWEWIWGRNPVYEVLRSQRRRLKRLLIAKGSNQNSQLDEIVQLARNLNLNPEWIPRSDLDRYADHHQGVLLQAGPYPYASLEDILDQAGSLNEPQFILLLDVLKDPQNLGTLFRTAEAVGVHGVALPYRRTATVTPAVVNASSGASEHLFVMQGNLAQTLEQLKEEGSWVVGLEGGQEASLPGEIDLTGPIAVVVGSEAEGMRRLVRESCDFLMRLPMRGKIDSLNAAVAGSVALYLVWQARSFR